MSNPQERIATRQLAIAPPSRPPTPTTPRNPAGPTAADASPDTTAGRRAPRTRADDVATIGKRQGKRRCVGFYLEASTQQTLRDLMARERITVAEAILLALRRLDDTTGIAAEESDEHPTFPIESRNRYRRNLDRPSTIYGLFTDHEALAIKAAADKAGATVSGLVSIAVDRLAHRPSHIPSSPPK